MKIFVCVDHDGHWPVPVASVVVAESEHDAVQLLDDALLKANLLPSSESRYTLTEVDASSPRAVILSDGNY